MSFPVVPAVIPHSVEAVKEYAQTLHFSPEFHLDLVDGNFVEAKSWPYEPAGEASEVGQVLSKYTLEVDLMVADPVRAAREWIDAGADMLVFHIETIPLQTFQHFAESTNISIGVSLHGDTSLDTFEEYLQYADAIQLMGIREIGAQGLPFDEKVLERIEYLKQKFPTLPLTVDGSVNPDTIVRLKEAGADRFIVGSAIVLQDNPKEAHAHLSSLING